MEKLIKRIRTICLWIIGIYVICLFIAKANENGSLTKMRTQLMPQGTTTTAQPVEGEPCLLNCERTFRTDINNNDEIYVSVQQKDGSLVLETLHLNNIIMFQIAYDNESCLAYGKDHTWTIKDRLNKITAQIELRNCDFFCQTNRRELVNIMYFDKYDRCNKEVHLDEELVSPVTGDRGTCLDSRLPVSSSN